MKIKTTNFLALIFLSISINTFAAEVNQEEIQKNTHDLHRAIYDVDLNGVKELLNKPFDPKGCFGDSLLVYTTSAPVTEGQKLEDLKKIVLLLLEAGCDLFEEKFIFLADGGSVGIRHCPEDTPRLDAIKEVVESFLLRRSLNKDIISLIEQYLPK